MSSSALLDPPLASAHSTAARNPEPSSARWPGWLAARPATAIWAMALLAVVLSCYPIIFLGKSFVSPNFGGLPLLYSAPPTLPGLTDLDQERSQGMDYGAMMWNNVAARRDRKPRAVSGRRAAALESFQLRRRHAAGPGHQHVRRSAAQSRAPGRRRALGLGPEVSARQAAVLRRRRLCRAGGHARAPAGHAVADVFRGVSRVLFLPVQPSGLLQPQLRALDPGLLAAGGGLRRMRAPRSAGRRG